MQFENVLLNHHKTLLRYNSHYTPIAACGADMIASQRMREISAFIITTVINEQRTVIIFLYSK